MEFTLSHGSTYNRHYAQNSHRYIPLCNLKDLEGFPKVTVRVHEFDALDDEQEILQGQVEALAMFGVIRLVYMDDEGNESRFYNVMQTVTAGKAQKEIVYEETSYTEEQVKALMDSEEGGCSGGACTI